MFSEILADVPRFLLIAIRALALIETAPLLSSDSNPQVAKVALAGFAAFAVFPGQAIRYVVPEPATISFIFLLAGEALIGVILGFFLTMIYTAFSSAGQFFSLQMGFGASETFDPLSQIENPLMGQYLNLVAMLVFLTVGGFQQIFLGGFQRSLSSINAIGLAAARDNILQLLLSGFSALFLDALIISMPILGTLFLISLSMGLLSKAAPQMNLLTEGFPISITVAFALILATMPFLVEAFARVIDTGFAQLSGLYADLGGLP